jgi:hypothetical protein
LAFPVARGGSEVLVHFRWFNHRPYYDYSAYPFFFFFFFFFFLHQHPMGRAPYDFKMKAAGVSPLQERHLRHKTT